MVYTLFPIAYPLLTFSVTLVFTATPVALQVSYYDNLTLGLGPRIRRGIKGRIVGGSQATPHEFPWIIELKERGSHFCGGSLLTPEYILTAAHCLQRKDAYDIEAVAGEHSMSRTEGTEQRGQCVQKTVHDRFDPNTFENDIALLRLHKPFDLNAYVKMLHLPETGFKPTEKATVAGWGYTSDGGSISEDLLKVEVPHVEDDICRNSYYDFESATSLCYGFPEGGKDSCSGDSGGPLMCGEKRVLCGLVSYGTGCARAGYPGVYTKVSNYIEWLTKKVGEMPEDNVNITEITGVCGGYYLTHTVKITLDDLIAGQRCLLVVQSQFDNVILKLSKSTLKKEDGLYGTKIYDTETADHVKIEEVGKDYVLKGGGVILITVDISATTDPSDKRSIVLEFSSTGGKDNSPKPTTLKPYDTSTPGTCMHPPISGNYNNNETAMFTLAAFKPSGVKDVTLTFTSLDVEHGDSMCDLDAVTVWAFRDGAYTMEARLCGSKIPKKIVLPGGIGLVTFVSDGTVVKKGFSFDYA